MCAIITKEAMNLKESGKRYTGRFWGRKNKGKKHCD